MKPHYFLNIMKYNKLTQFAVCASLLSAASASSVVLKTTDFSSAAQLLSVGAMTTAHTPGLWYTSTSTDLAISGGSLNSTGASRYGFSTFFDSSTLSTISSEYNRLRVTFDYTESYASEDVYLHVMGFVDNGSNATPSTLLVNNVGTNGVTWSSNATMADYDVYRLTDGGDMGADRSWDLAYGVQFSDDGTELSADFGVDFSAYDYITVSFGRYLGGTGFSMDNIVIEAVPEPSALALLGLGSLALVTRRKR